MKRLWYLVMAVVAGAAMLVSCKEDNNKTYTFDAGVETLGFAGDGDTREVSLETDSKSWTTTVSDAWITVTPAEGSRSTTLTITTSANPSSTQRSGYVTIKDKHSFMSFVNVNIVQSGKGEPRPSDVASGGQEAPGEEDESTIAIEKSAFTGTSEWGVTGSIMGLDWSSDKAMLSEPLWGWVAAFDIEVGDNEEFKFRKDKAWTTNFGTRNNYQPGIDKKYTVADNGGNFKLPKGKYDLYLQPTYMLLYVLEAGSKFTHADAEPSKDTGENVRIYVLNNSDWTTPYMYAYVGDGGQLQPYGTWPGTYATGSKEIGQYIYTYWDAAGFSGINGINLIINDGGAHQYPAAGEKDPLWSNLTILQTTYFAWDGKKLTAIEDPENPGVEGKGIAPDEIKIGTSSWTIIGKIAGYDWNYDIPMDTEGYWEVARDVEIKTTDQFKFRQNRSWAVNFGAGPYSETGANAFAVGEKIAVSSGAGNIAVKEDGKFDLYLSTENGILYILKAGATWTHEAEGKPDYVLGGSYDPNLLPSKKLSGITYQVNVFSFKDSNGDGWGDLNGIRQSLDYFDALGVTALWLSPIQPAQSYHGYDVTDYESVNPRYGTEEDFQALITEAHNHNIRIYMDYVINHAGDQSLWFKDVKANGTESPYWNYFSLSKDPQKDIKAGKIAQVDAGGFDSSKWYPVTIGGGGKVRYTVELDWTNDDAPKITVKETPNATVTTSGTTQNPARWLYWGGGNYTQFYDNGTDKYKLVLDYESEWGCLVRTRNDDVWTGKSKWGFNKVGDQLKDGTAHQLYSDDNPDKVQSIVMPGGELYYYYTEFGTGAFVDFNYGPAASCASSDAFKAIMVGIEKWLKMGVDGFRLDAVKHIYHNETGANNKTFWAAFYDACNKIYKANSSARSGLKGIVDKDIFMVGEVLSGDGDCTPFYSCLPALFEFQFWWDLRECLNGENTGNAGYGQSFSSSLPYRWNNHLAVRSSAISTPKLANHDEDRTASTLGKYKPKIRLAACVLLTAPGRPYIYQGEELGYWGTKSGGDEYVRTPILWTGDHASAAVKGVSNKVDWNMLTESISVAHQAKDDASLLMLYRHFAYAKNVNAALANGYPEADEKTAGDSQIAGWYLHSTTASKDVLVLHNFSSVERTVERWDGENLNNILVSNGRVTVSGKNVTLPPYSSVVFALN
ncbi:MAG: starch-binding protein [Bacteroidales bacterium]|nr:starch-binding protein [Bacteroidales bacterium]